MRAKMHYESRIPVGGLSGFNWEDLRVFLLVANQGTAIAAERLAMDVTTVRRRVASLEQSLGLRLLVRGGRSFKLTDDGERVCAAAAAMNECSLQIARDVMDGQRELEGVVRISTMEGFGAGYLAPRMATLLDGVSSFSVQ